LQLQNDVFIFLKNRILLVLFLYFKIEPVYKPSFVFG